MYIHLHTCSSCCVQCYSHSIKLEPSLQVTVNERMCVYMYMYTCTCKSCIGCSRMWNGVQITQQISTDAWNAIPVWVICRVCYIYMGTVCGGFHQVDPIPLNFQQSIHRLHTGVSRSVTDVQGAMRPHMCNTAWVTLFPLQKHVYTYIHVTLFTVVCVQVHTCILTMSP